MPDGKVKIPGIGEVSQRTAVIAGIGVAGIGGVLYWRWRKNQVAAQAQTVSQDQTGTGMVTDPAGNQCAEVDPNTGYCPGTAEDEQAAQQAAYGSDIGVGYDSGAGIAGTGLYTDPNGNVCVTPDADGYCPQTVSGGGGGTPGTYTTNDQWYLAVIGQFPNYRQAVADVLGGVTVTTNEKDQFLAAVGVFGLPPEGYPQPIKTSDTAGHPGGTKSATVPNVVGKHAAAAKSDLELAGFKVVQEPASTPRGKSAIVQSQDPRGNTKAAHGATVTIHVRVT
jgi:PASTA domain